MKSSTYSILYCFYYYVLITTRVKEITLQTTSASICFQIVPSFVDVSRFRNIFLLCLGKHNFFYKISNSILRFFYSTMWWKTSNEFCRIAYSRMYRATKMTLQIFLPPNWYSLKMQIFSKYGNLIFRWNEYSHWKVRKWKIYQINQYQKMLLCNDISIFNSIFAHACKNVTFIRNINSGENLWSSGHNPKGFGWISHISRVFHLIHLDLKHCVCSIPVNGNWWLL